MKIGLALRFLLLLSLCFFVSCSDKDLYDESNNVAESAELFGDSVNISDSFDWATSKTVTLSVTVDDQYNGLYDYRVEVYDANPLFDSDASLLSAGVAKSGQNFESSVEVLSGVSVLYVKQTDPTGKVRVSSVTLSGATTESLSFATSSTTKSTALKSVASLLKSTTETTTAEPSVPSDATEITGSGSYTITANSSARKNYVITGNFTGTISFNGGWGQGISLYVEGAWSNSGASISLGSGDHLYVLSGGRVTVGSVTTNNTASVYNYGTLSATGLNFTNSTTLENDGTLKVSGSSTFSSSVTLLNTGTATFSSSFNITNTFTFNNSGTVTFADATFSNGSFVNTGTASFSTLTSTTGSTTIQNDGTLSATTGILTNATLIANCHTTLGTLTTNGAAVYVAGGALLDITTLSSGGTYYYLASSAILDVSSSAYFSSQRNYMIGSGTSLALAKMTKVTADWQGITYSGYLEIECSDHVSNGLYSTYYILQSPAAFVASGETSVEIAATDCNDGGNNVTTTTTPTSQTVTDVALGTYSYAFEDQWPKYGDYDMNDFVSDITLTRTQNSDNLTTKLVIATEIRALGASTRLGAAIQLDGIEASSVKSVTYSNTDIVGTNFPLTSAGIESGQTYAVVPICDDAHKAFGLSSPLIVNTSSLTLDPVYQTITIVFATPQSLLTNADLNLFIVTAGYASSKRTEIHLNERAATDKVNSSLFSSANLKSESDPYRSHENLVWGICVPGSFDYPSEGVLITKKYPDFEKWAESDGTEYTTWYGGN